MDCVTSLSSCIMLCCALTDVKIVTVIGNGMSRLFKEDLTYRLKGSIN
jgi:hypothetical protein